MPRRYFNWKLAIVLVLIMVVVAAAAVALRKWQKNRRSVTALANGNAAYAEYDWDTAASELGRYLATVRDDIEILDKYAQAQLNRRPVTTSAAKQAMEVYRSILRLEPDNSDAVEKLSQLFLDMGQSSEAELITKRFLEKNDDPQVRYQCAIALSRQRKFAESFKMLKKLIADHPDYIRSYYAIQGVIASKPDLSAQPKRYWYDLAVKNNPDSAMAYIQLAAFQLFQKQRPQALQTIDKVIECDLSDSKDALSLVKLYLQLDMTEQAAALLEKVKAGDADDIEVWRVSADIALKSGSSEKMAEVAREGIQSLKTLPWDFFPVAIELFARAGDYEKAAEYLTKMEDKQIAPLTVGYLRGFICDLQGNKHKAIQFWKKSLNPQRPSVKTRIDIAVAQAQIGDNISAFRDISVLAREDLTPAQLGRVHLLLGSVASELKRWQQVSDSAAQVMKIYSPDTPQYRQGLLFSLESRFNLEKNTKTYRDILNVLNNSENLEKQDLQASMLKIKALVGISDFDQAQQVAEKLIADNPENITCLLSKADILYAQNKDQQAIDYLIGLTERFQGKYEPVRFLASVYDVKSQPDKAVVLLKKALEKAQTSSPDKQLIASMLARMYFKLEQTASAREVLEGILQEYPLNISIRNQLLNYLTDDAVQTQTIIDQIREIEGDDGWQWKIAQARVWIFADDFKVNSTKAITYLKDIFQQYPDLGYASFLLGLAYEKNGDMKMALSSYKQAVDRSPESASFITAYASALYKTDQPQKAADVLKKTSSVTSSNSLDMLRLQSHLYQNELDSAVTVISEILSKDPQNKAVKLKLAQIKLSNKDFAQADAILAELLKENPEALPVISVQIGSYLGQNKKDQAIQLADKTVQQLNNSPACLLRAAIYQQFSQNDKALADYNKAIQIDPKDITAILRRAALLTLMGQPQDALADVDKAIQIEPDNTEIRKAVVIQLLNSADEALVKHGDQILHDSLTEYPEDNDFLMLSAQLLVAKAGPVNLKQAKDILEKMVTSNENNEQLWTLLARIALLQSMPDKALEMTLRGLSISPDSNALLVLKSRAEAATSPALAVPTLKSLYEKNPGNTELAMQLGSAYISSKSYAQAIAFLTKELDNYTDLTAKTRLKTILAAAVYKNGGEAEAMKMFDEVEKILPDNSSVALTRMSTLVDAGRFEDVLSYASKWHSSHTDDISVVPSIVNYIVSVSGIDNMVATNAVDEILTSAIKVNPKASVFKFTLASICQMMGKNQKAVDLYRLILKDEPENILTINNLAWELIVSKKNSEALELAEKGLKIAPDYIDLVDTRGVALMDLGQYEKSIADFKRCLEYYPDSSPSKTASAFHLGKAYFSSGKIFETKKALQQALDLNNKNQGLSKQDIAEINQMLEKQ